MRYNLDKLIQDFETGNPAEFLFFWGHRRRPDQKIGKQCLSQWFDAGFTFEEVEYRTAEHWMMAKKAQLFDDQNIFEKIIESNDPKEVKALGREIKNFGPQVWDDHKFQIVVDGNLHKFTQNAQLFKYLKATHNKYLLEASPYDVIWGIGVAEDNEEAHNPYAWSGQNLLGFALMEVRDKLENLDYFKFLEDPFEPPWKIYPDIDCSDMFFRMGAGEGYSMLFWEWFDALSPTDKEIYKITFPPQSGWERSFK